MKSMTQYWVIGMIICVLSGWTSPAGADYVFAGADYASKAGLFEDYGSTVLACSNSWTSAASVTYTVPLTAGTWRIGAEANDMIPRELVPNCVSHYCVTCNGSFSLSVGISGQQGYSASGGFSVALNPGSSGSLDFTLPASGCYTVTFSGSPFHSSILGSALHIQIRKVFFQYLAGTTPPPPLPVLTVQAPDTIAHGTTAQAQAAIDGAAAPAADVTWQISKYEPAAPNAPLTSSHVTINAAGQITAAANSPSGWVTVRAAATVSNQCSAGIKVSGERRIAIVGPPEGLQAPDSANGHCGQNCSQSGPPNTCDGVGAPMWAVNMTDLNLYMTDTPLWYAPSIGPAVNLALSYNSQADALPNAPFGHKWQFGYASALTEAANGDVTIAMPDGRQDVYPRLSGTGTTSVYGQPYQVWNRLTKTAANQFELRFPDDALYVYQIPANSGLTRPTLTRVQDRYGQALTLAYTSSGQLVGITDALNQLTTLTYTNGRVTRVDDPFGRFALFEYDASGNLTKLTDMGGYWTRLEYDARSHPTAYVNDRGRWTFRIEPPDGLANGMNPYPAPGAAMSHSSRITITNPLGHAEEYFYSHVTGKSWHISPHDYVAYVNATTNNAAASVPKTVVELARMAGGQGEIARVTSPQGTAVTYAYDNGANTAGNRTSVSDGVNPAWQYTYNSQGRVTSVTDAKGNPPTTLAYAANGVDLTQISNGLGSITLTYTARRDVASITDRLGRMTRFGYTGNGQMLWQKEYLNGAEILTEYAYNAQHWVNRVQRAGQAIASFTYDAVGRTQTATDATGQTLTYAYNTLNNVTKVTYPDGKAVTYAYSGCCPRLLDSVTDRAGRVTRYTYDAVKNLVATLAPGNAATTYVYDQNNNLVSFTDAAQHTTSFTYDRDNRLTRKTYADGKYVQWAYNPVGLTRTFTNARNTVTTYTYDANHNLTLINYGDATPDVTYTYDAYDRTATMTDGIGAWTFGYNANSELLSVDGPWANDTVTYVPDDLGRIRQMIPQGGTTVSYVYDALDRLTQVQRGTENFTYAYTGVNPLVQTLTRPNGSVTAYQYNALNQLTKILNRTSTGAVLSQHTYTYNGQDMRATEIFDGSAIPPAPAVPDTNTTSTVNAVNQLLSTAAPSRTFVYDLDGNLTQGYTKDGYVFTAAYDAENRLTSIQYTDSSSVLHRQEFRYSGDDVLAEQTRFENGSLVETIRIVRDGMLAIQDRNAGNVVVNEYTWGLNLGGGIEGLLNLKTAGQNYAYLYDGTGNVEAVLNASQQVVAAYRYDPFGVLLAKTGSFEQPFGFSTKRYNAPVGMVQYEARNYFPPIGRWDRRDPLGEAGGLNLYAFVGNNPVNWVDPWGLARKPGRTPPSLWPPLPDNVGGKKPKWNPEGYWEGKRGRKVTWDDRSHGAGVDRGQGEQGGHWDDESSNNRWDEDGNLLPGSDDYEPEPEDENSNQCEGLNLPVVPPFIPIPIPVPGPKIPGGGGGYPVYQPLFPFIPELA